MTTVNENVDNNEEVKTKKQEDFEMILDMVQTGNQYWSSVKNRLIGKGFAMGLVTAVAIQSVITIILLLTYMN